MGKIAQFVIIVCLNLQKVLGERCVLRETSRYPWVIKIWKSAIVGHGALLNEYKVLSSCSAFANLSDLTNEQYEMIAHDTGGAERRNLSTSCTAIRYAKKVNIHPLCSHLNESQLHDVAVWSLDSPFDVLGKAFLLLPLRKTSVKIKFLINSTESCKMIYADDPSNRDSLVKTHRVGRCGYTDLATLEVCDGADCPQQALDGLLCFYSLKEGKGSWVTRQPADTPDFVEGSVVLCFGSPIGIAGRTFFSNEYQAYRMFSNVKSNLGFILDASRPSTTPSTTSAMQFNPIVPVVDEGYQGDDGGRISSIAPTPAPTTPIDCSCVPFEATKMVTEHGSGQTSLPTNYFWHVIAIFLIHVMYVSVYDFTDIYSAQPLMLNNET